MMSLPSPEAAVSERLERVESGSTTATGNLRPTAVDESEVFSARYLTLGSAKLRVYCQCAARRRL
jgi:hypothetical protein